MPKLKISALPGAGPLLGPEMVPLVQTGVTRETTIADIGAYAAGLVVAPDLQNVLSQGNTTGLIDIIFANQTASTVPYFDGTKKLVSSAVTPTELGYLSGVTGAIQTQINVLQTGLRWKAPARVAIGTNITILTPPASIDGITMAVNDRVLLFGQTDPKENGLYLWTGSTPATPMVRTTDADLAAEILGMVVNILEGTWADKGYTCTNDTITIGVTNLAFAIWGGTTYIGTSNRITVTGNVIDIAATYVGQASITTLGTVTTGTLGSGVLVLLGSDTTGDMYYNGGSGVLTRLAAGAAGKILMYNGVGAAPIVSTLVMPNAVSSTQILHATSANTIGGVAGLYYNAGELGIASVLNIGGSTIGVMQSLGSIFSIAGTSTGSRFLNQALSIEYCRFVSTGNMSTSNFYFGGTTTPTARAHFASETGTASTEPIRFTSPAAIATAVAQSHGPNVGGDSLYYVITTGAARKNLVMDDGTLLVATYMPVASTNGRLIDSVITQVSTNIGIGISPTAKFHIGGNSAFKTRVSGAGTLTLGAETTYIANGTTATWSLPTIAASNTDWIFFVKNRGSGNLTMDVVGGASTIYDTAAVASITILPGSAAILQADGTYWNLM